MKKVALIIAVIFAMSNVYSQSARSLLAEVSQKVKSYDNIQIDFKYNLSNAKEKVNQDTRGDVTLSGNKYILHMMGTTRLFDGKKIFTIVPEDEEVNISNYNAQDDKEITP